MSFAQSGLTLLHYHSVGVSTYHYTTNDTTTLVEGAGYFRTASPSLRTGDTVLATCDMDGTPAVRMYLVSAVDGSGVPTIVTHPAAYADQVKNKVLAGPATGSDAQPAFRLLVGADIPALTVLNCTVTLTDGDSGYVVSPIAGTVSRIDQVLLGGAVSTNNAVCTWKIGAAGAGAAITSGAVTVTASGSALGDLDTASPSAANTVAAGSLIYCTVSGTPGGSRTGFVTILIKPTATS